MFASSTSDAANCHALCEALAQPERIVSPTRFTNSVHNAAAGYWHIATTSRAPSTTVCAFDASFGAGLLEAATQCIAWQRPVLFVAADVPYPQPLHAVRPLADAFGVALLIDSGGDAPSLARLSVCLTRRRDERLSACRARRAAHRDAGSAQPAAARRTRAQRAGSDRHRDARRRCAATRRDAVVMPSTALDHAGIASRIPHQGRMCVLDSCVGWSSTDVHCRATSHHDPAHPLRSASGLLAPCAIEYAAQAMALHGALLVGEGDRQRPGVLVSVRGVRLTTARLDDIDDALDVFAERLAGDERQVLYAFRVADARGAMLAEGRATVVLGASGASPSPPSVELG